jgi:hypothetical protein
MRKPIDFRQAAEKADPISGKTLLFMALRLNSSSIWTREWSHSINPSLRVRQMTIDAIFAVWPPGILFVNDRLDAMALHSAELGLHYTSELARRQDRKVLLDDNWGGSITEA